MLIYLPMWEIPALISIVFSTLTKRTALLNTKIFSLFICKMGIIKVLTSQDFYECLMSYFYESTRKF